MVLTFIGDIHSQFSVLDRVAYKANSDVIIQVGDFGIWPGLYDKVHTQSNIPVYFCRGNHENHDVLDTFPPYSVSNLKLCERVDSQSLYEKGYSSDCISECKSIEFPNSNNIFYCSDGSYLTLNGKTILFIGGASSIDKKFRVENVSWWSQEILNYKQMNKILDIVECSPSPDIIVSHTCPEMIFEKMEFNKYSDNDPTRYLLEQVYESTHPQFWVFGHFHNPFIYDKEDTEFIGLSSCDPVTGDFSSGFYYNLEI